MPQGTEVAREGHGTWVEEPKHLLSRTYIFSDKKVSQRGLLRYEMFWGSRGSVRSFTSGNRRINSIFYIGISLLTNK